MRTYLLLITLLSGFNIYTQEIKYHLTPGNYKSSALIAELDGKTFTLIQDEETCIDIIEEGDFNNDGYKDVLIENITGCGSSCCGYNYQIFSFDGTVFRETEEVGYDWSGIQIAEGAGEYNFIVDWVPLGVGNTSMCNTRIETYRLNNYDWELINVVEDIELNALTEIRSADFEGRETEELSLIFDLDRDGIDDEITCKYWMRWGAIGEWAINFGDGKTLSFNSNPKRIGVRHTITNGVYDLVLECDAIYKWDGDSYVLNE